MCQDKQPTFKQLESAKMGDHFDWQTLKAQVKFDKDGLIPAIAQQFDTKEVLMMAWMNLQSLEETLATGRVCYWSRSRQNYWRKGEESGQIQVLKSLAFDCDGDTILLSVDPQLATLADAAAFTLRLKARILKSPVTR